MGPRAAPPPSHPTSGSGTGESFGCLPFTKSFRKIRMKRNWNTVFRVAPVENFREQRIESARPFQIKLEFGSVSLQVERKTGESGEKPIGARGQPKTTFTHGWCRWRDLNPGTIG